MRRQDGIIAALSLGTLAMTGRAFYPTDPPLAYGLSAVLILYALIHLGRGMGWLSSPRSRWGRALNGVGHLPLMLALGVMVVHSVVMLFILSGVALTVISLLTVAVLTRWARKWRRETLSSVHLRARLWVILFLVAGAYVPLCAYIWHQPDPEACAAVVEHPAVTRLTSERYPAMRSFPYELAMLGDTGRIAASFKMAGNLTIRPWDDPAANLLVVIDPSDLASPQVGALALGGEALPQYMVYDPARQEVVVNRLGFGDDLMEVIDVSSFPDLRRVRRHDAVDQPHAMHLLEGGQILVTTMRREVYTLDYETMLPRSRVAVPTWFATPGFTFTDLTLSPDRGVGFASTLGTDVVRIDPRGDGAVRHRGRGFGAGEITHHPSAPRLYETDFFQDSLRVIDSRTLETTQEVALGFSPRPVAISPRRDLVAVGDWFSGVVHLLSIDTLSARSTPIPVGRYLREFALDEARGRLYAASTCGVYAIDLDRLTQAP